MKLDKLSKHFNVVRASLTPSPTNLLVRHFPCKATDCIVMMEINVKCLFFNNEQRDLWFWSLVNIGTGVWINLYYRLLCTRSAVGAAL